MSEDAASRSEDNRLARAMAVMESANTMQDASLLQDVEAALFGAPAEPWRLGRYVVLDVVGKGGFGTVFAGYDPELDRKVAIKILRRSVSEGSTGSRGEQLRSEAQAMAMISHPNVASVFDVARVGAHEAGTLAEEGQLFLVMEFLEGGTLSAHLDERRAAREIVDVFLQAARGLEAAHSRDLVHLDFKPTNVMFDADGRVRVLDFGLARPRDGVGPGPEGASGTSGAGTPHYMAPEQLEGGTVDARADQYAFCLSLYEALCHEPVFTGRTRETLIAEKRGPLPEPPEGARVPAHLMKIVRRGLAPNPADRYPDFASLIADLEIDPRARARKRWMIAGAAAAVIGLLAGTSALISEYRHQCDVDPQGWEGVWDGGLRARFVAALERTQPPTSAERVALGTKLLDAYRQSWDDTYTQTCRAARFARRQSEEDFERQRFCLDRQRQLVAGWLRSGLDDAELAGSLMRQAQNLPRPVACLLDDGDASPQINPAQHRDRALELSTKVARADVLGVAGRFDEARRAGREAVEEARAIEDALSEAWAQRSLTRLALAEARYDDCEAPALAAMAAADRAGAPEPWVDAARHWMNCHTRAGRFEAAETLAGMTRSRIEAEQVKGQSAAAFEASFGTYLLRRGRPVEARESLARAQQMIEAEVGPESVKLAHYLNELGNAWIEDPADDERAYGYYLRALDLWKRNYGAEHENVGHVSNNLAIILERRGEFGEARERLELALSIYREVFGPEALALTNPHINLSSIESSLGNPKASLEHAERALALFEKQLGSDNPLTVPPVANRCIALAELGRRDEALGALDEALRTINFQDNDLAREQLAWIQALLLVQAGRVEAGVKAREALVGGRHDDPPEAALVDAALALANSDAAGVREGAKAILEAAESGSVATLEARVLAHEAAALDGQTPDESLQSLRSEVESRLRVGHPLVGRMLLAEAKRRYAEEPAASRRLAEEARSLLGPGITARQAAWLHELR